MKYDGSLNRLTQEGRVISGFNLVNDIFIGYNLLIK